MVINRKCAVQRSAVCFADLSENQQYLLVNLYGISIVSISEKQRDRPKSYPRPIKRGERAGRID
jgi:6-phosphogluconolactonase (cycloisomerase 2 family)